ncbi:MAG: excalibur calcium-binding domain-containing protein [Alteraurantiacibacter sp.]
MIGAIALGTLTSLSFVVPQVAIAHPGGLASDGCHNDRKNGGRHCHRGSNAGSNVKPKAPKSRSGTYANCTEARNAGAAPVKRGDPGYGPHLDRDNDGIGCE